LITQRCDPFCHHTSLDHGNSPSKGPTQVIAHGSQLYVTASNKDWEGVADFNQMQAKLDARLRSLWKPLPVSSERVRLWMRHCYQHFAHCSHDPELEESGKPALLLYPVPPYKLRHFADDVRFSAEWRALEHKKIDLENREIVARAERLATPERHKAVTWIRRFYADYAPDLPLIAAPPTEGLAHWYEVEAECPTPERCRSRNGMRHPVNGTWCQVCGWQQSDDAQTAETANNGRQLGEAVCVRSH
jgi:hypothetical protein